MSRVEKRGKRELQIGIPESERNMENSTMTKGRPREEELSQKVACDEVEGVDGGQIINLRLFFSYKN